MQQLYASLPWALSTTPPSTAHQYGVAVYIHLLDRPTNDALHMMTGCLKPTTTKYLPVLSGLPSAEPSRKATTLSLACQSLEPDHTPYKYFNRPMTKRCLKSRKLFVIKAQGLLAQNTNAPTWIHNTWKDNWTKNILSSLFCYQCRTTTNRS